MAAGLGTRLKPFTDQIPKPLIPVLGIPVIQYAIDILTYSGVKKTVVNYHHLPEVSRTSLDALDWQDQQVVLSDESNRLLGSAGGIRKVLSQFEDQPFFVINADVITSVDLGKLEERHRELKKRHDVWMTMTLCPNGKSGVYREILMDPSTELVLGTGEKVAARPFYLGVGIFEPKAFQHLVSDEPSEFFPDVFEPALKKKKVGFYLEDPPWWDIGEPQHWWKTHFELMRAEENGLLPKVWSDRLALENQILSSEIWISRSCPDLKKIQWEKPVYYWGEEKPPQIMGPKAVSYGVCTESHLSKFISLNGNVVRF